MKRSAGTVLYFSNNMKDTYKQPIFGITVKLKKKKSITIGYYNRTQNTNYKLQNGGKLACPIAMLHTYPHNILF